MSEVLGDLSFAPKVSIPMFRDHSGVTVIPLLSQLQPSLPANLSSPDLQAVTSQIQFRGDDVVKAKDSTGSVTLSMVFSGAQFTNLVIKVICGAKESSSGPRVLRGFTPWATCRLMSKIS